MDSKEVIQMALEISHALVIGLIKGARDAPLTFPTSVADAKRAAAKAS